MSINYIILLNLRKNIKNYYLYVFALVFGVALYFSFVTLKYDPSLDIVAGSIKGGAAIGASSVLLVAIVAIFLLYANTIFIKRRSREIGLFQLIGLTKGKIFKLLSAENLILYFGSMFLGIGAGFAVSRLILMILFKILAIESVAKLRFSMEALQQTVIVFAGIYLLIMLMNYTFIKAQSILSLFMVSSTAQERIRKMPLWEIVLGLLGIGCIASGYYLSTLLFSGNIDDMTRLMTSMIVILGLVIIGTYLFYKGSVSFVFNAIRKSKQGYLTINEVLSLSSIMFRMKSNALLLTIITTVSALAIGLLSLSYIAYYSAGAKAKDNSPHDFGFAQVEAKERFVQALDKAHIKYSEVHMQPIPMEVDGSQIMEQDSRNTVISTLVVSDSSVEGVDLKPGEARFMDYYNNVLSSYMTLKESGGIGFKTMNGTIEQQLTGISGKTIMPYFYSKGAGVFVVDETVYEELAQGQDPKLRSAKGAAAADYFGIELADRSQLKDANQIFTDQKPGKMSISQYEYKMNHRSGMGLIMFIVGFLGLTFLITSGCILYFKQMDEGEEEKAGYTILRKLGFTQGDLLRGIQFKQLFNFGIPLVVGLSHSYFAVKSGWFFFGTEMLTPMIMVMLLYTVLYSIFGFLSVLYYKRVISESL
ncbi:FtsX-like permease family protein [Paenibacillus sonchi]|uniref:FtsX-like permease family protein n=1 Tax=Paenibacillus sonchi TaxID=373687 RepID=UPI001E3195DC|nr:ABC transporter permease [Paenibacillus sonchi]MCE3201701.1 ABC transporter permease [Paenibacillus sonchi]